MALNRIRPVAIASIGSLAFLLTCLAGNSEVLAEEGRVPGLIDAIESEWRSQKSIVASGVVEYKFVNLGAASLRSGVGQSDVGPRLQQWVDSSSGDLKDLLAEIVRPELQARIAWEQCTLTLEGDDVRLDSISQVGKITYLFGRRDVLSVPRANFGVEVSREVALYGSGESRIRRPMFTDICYFPDVRLLRMGDMRVVGDEIHLQAGRSQVKLDANTWGVKYYSRQTRSGQIDSVVRQGSFSIWPSDVNVPARSARERYMNGELASLKLIDLSGLTVNIDVPDETFLEPVRPGHVVKDYRQDLKSPEVFRVHEAYGDVQTCADERSAGQ